MSLDEICEGRIGRCDTSLDIESYAGLFIFIKIRSEFRSRGDFVKISIGMILPFTVRCISRVDGQRMKS
jgi:hypothetical protein